MSLRLDWEHRGGTGEASADLVCFGDSSPIRIRVRHGNWFGFGRWLAMIDVSRVYAYRTEAIAPDVPRADRVPSGVLAEAEAWAFGNMRVCGGQSA